VGVARVGKKTGRWFDSMAKAAPEPLKKVYLFKYLGILLDILLGILL
jgi:hypothetical protein